MTRAERLADAFGWVASCIDVASVIALLFLAALALQAVWVLGVDAVVMVRHRLTHGEWPLTNDRRDARSALLEDAFRAFVGAVVLAFLPALWLWLAVG